MPTGKVSDHDHRSPLNLSHILLTLTYFYGLWIYLCTDGSRIFIVTARYIKTKKRTVHHESSPLRKCVLVQELVLDQKLAAFMRIAVIKLFYFEAQRNRLFWRSIATRSNFTYLFVPHPSTQGELNPTLDNPGTVHWFVCNAEQSVWVIVSRAQWYYSLSGCF